jgi:hypothetical protein
MAKFTKREIGMTAIGGSCLCGGVKFEITGPLSSPLNCHCSQCRKQHGAPFRSRVRVQVEDFRWLQGEHLIKYYESAGGYLRGLRVILVTEKPLARPRHPRRLHENARAWWSMPRPHLAVRALVIKTAG